MSTEKPTMDIVALFQCLRPSLPSTTWRQLSRIALALLVMTGRVTMLGISRWAGKGGSYRTVQRFFSTVIPWAILFWVFFRQHVYCPDDVSLAAGADVIVTKAGTCTHGLDRFFASLYGKPMPGVAFFTLSLVRVQKRRAFPMRVEQGVRSDAEKAASKAQAAAKKPKAPHTKRRPGRPHFQAAVRCGAVLPLYWSLCWARSPAQVWPQGGLRSPSGAIPQREDCGGAHRDPPLPDASAP